MKPLQILVADTDSAHIQRISQCLAHRRDMLLAGHAANGAEALDRITRGSIDVLITEIQLPGLDGIMLLKELQNLRKPPVAIVCTHFYSNLCVNRAQSLGAGYVLYKPLDYSRLCEVISACVQSRRRPDPSVLEAEKLEKTRRIMEASRFLRRMGIPAQLTGSLYLIESMRWYDSNPAMTRNLRKGLYAQISETLQTTPTRVERSLRTAIAAGYDRGDLRKHFECRPTNREFIEYMYSCLESGEYADSAQ